MGLEAIQQEYLRFQQTGYPDPMFMHQSVSLTNHLLEVAIAAKGLTKHICKIQTIDNKVPSEWMELQCALQRLEAD